MGKIKRICNGNIVTPDRIIKNGTIVLEDNTIVDIKTIPVKESDPDDIDATGMWVLPGLVDSHSDAIEQAIEPRPTSVMPVKSAFYELERSLVGQGITTMFHSLSLYYTGNEGNWVRRNDNVRHLIYQMKELTNRKALIRNKIHLRYEMRNIDGLDLVEDLLSTKMIDQISFMDHTPGKGQWHDIEAQKKKIMKRLNLTSEEADKHIEELQKDTNIDMQKMNHLANIAFEHGIPLASHDDDSKEKIDLLEKWKGSISEFPISLEVAQEARRRDFYVVVGAPNLLLGGSHNKNLSSFVAIEAGAVDILCSDYYPGSLLQGIFYLYKKGYDLVQAVNLASLNPAKALGIAQNLGSLEPGKKADLLLVTEEQGDPVLQKVLVDGEIVYQIAYREL